MVLMNICRGRCENDIILFGLWPIIQSL